MAPEGVVRVLGRIDGELDDGEVDACELNGLRRPAQAGLDEGRRRQRGHVQHAARPGDPFERVGDRGIGQLHDEREVRLQLLDAERRLQRVDLVDLDADHRGGTRQACFLESLAPMGVAPNVGDAPIVQGPGEAGVGVVVDHDDLRAAEGELLHGAQSDTLEAADDHVTIHVVGLHANHPRMLPSRFAVDVAAALNVRARGFRGLEPTWGCSSVVRAGDS